MPALRRGLVAMAAAASLAASASPDAVPDTGAVLRALNDLRRDPTDYAGRLEEYRAGFDRSDPLIHRAPDDPIGRRTLEGAPAVTETIAVLRSTPPRAPFERSVVLEQAARDYVALQGPIGAMGHNGGGTTPGTRVARRGGGIYVAETIGYGPRTAAELVRQLVVDDGVASRGHRAILLSPRFRFVGVACGAHRVHGTMCVLDFSETATGEAAVR